MASQLHPLLLALTEFPNRAAGSHYAKQAQKLLSDTLIKEGFQVYFQEFTAPKSYVPIVYQITGVIMIGLAVGNAFGWVSTILVTWLVIEALLYFDWRKSNLIGGWINTAPMANVIGNYSPPAASQKLILMAHFDTAPVSALYKNQTKNSFRNSMRITMLMILLAIPTSILLQFYTDSLALNIVRIGLILYFAGQTILGTIGYWQKGFTNGASDNATGVIAALETAKRLQSNLTNTTIEVVFTDAEEAGMIGAYHYWRKLKQQQRSEPQQIYLINFDTLGAGELKYITKTGSLTDIIYDNVVTQTAARLTNEVPRLQHIKADSWHTADFDSVWFVRDGIPCVTLAALDQDGLMPRIHRPEDTLAHIDTRPMYDAIDLAEAIALELDK